MSYAKREQAIQSLLDIQRKRRIGTRLTLAEVNNEEDIHLQYPEYQSMNNAQLLQARRDNDIKELIALKSQPLSTGEQHDAKAKLEQKYPEYKDKDASTINQAEQIRKARPQLEDEAPDALETPLLGDRKDQDLQHLINIQSKRERAARMLYSDILREQKIHKQYPEFENMSRSQLLQARREHHMKELIALVKGPIMVSEQHDKKMDLLDRYPQYKNKNAAEIEQAEQAKNPSTTPPTPLSIPQHNADNRPKNNLSTQQEIELLIAYKKIDELNGYMNAMQVKQWTELNKKYNNATVPELEKLLKDTQQQQVHTTVHSKKLDPIIEDYKKLFGKEPVIKDGRTELSFPSAKSMADFMLDQSHKERAFVVVDKATNKVMAYSNGDGKLYHGNGDEFHPGDKPEPSGVDKSDFKMPERASQRSLNG